MTAEATKILEENVQGGTGTRAQIGCPAAGKTGHDRPQHDAWFVGFTPRLATAVWVGYPNAADRDERRSTRTQRRRRHVPRRDLGRVHEAGVKGKFCGGFRPPKTPFVSQPFFGHYATTGKPKCRHRRAPAATRPTARSNDGKGTGTSRHRRQDDGRRQRRHDLRPEPVRDASPRARRRPSRPAARATGQRHASVVWAPARPTGTTCAVGPPRAAMVVCGKAVPAAPPRACLIHRGVQQAHGYRCREVVQRREGLRIHHA